VREVGGEEDEGEGAVSLSLKPARILIASIKNI